MSSPHQGAEPAHDATVVAARVAASLAQANGAGLDQQSMLVLKVCEEAGEAAAAWIGVRGQNPRKGVTHTHDDVAGELADVALAALVAIAGIGLDPGRVLDDCVAKVTKRLIDRPDALIHPPA
ncbi:hypothetical protein ACIA5A_29055 [Micromonospora sp. NPDC051300]|uniref:hypothetical protein n=1 Tax=Micromonospora sp. NPDC051300 TaxID=3364286 RepID=UPI0037B65515